MAGGAGEGAAGFGVPRGPAATAATAISPAQAAVRTTCRTLRAPGRNESMEPPRWPHYVTGRARPRRENRCRGGRPAQRRAVDPGPDPPAGGVAATGQPLSHDPG